MADLLDTVEGAWTPANILDPYGRPARPVTVPLYVQQLHEDLREQALRDRTCFGWLDGTIYGPDGKTIKGRGQVVKFTRYE